MSLIIIDWEDNALAMILKPGNLPIIIVLDNPGHEELVVLELPFMVVYFCMLICLSGKPGRFFI